MKYSENLKTDKMYSASATEIGGIEKNVRNKAGSPLNSLNISDKNYPGASVRPRRAVIRELSSADGLYGDDTLAWVEGGKFYYGGLEVNGIYLSPGRKKILGFGRLLLIFPDMIYYDTSSGEYGSMSVSASAETAYVCCVDSALSEITGYTVAKVEPEEAAVGDYCAVTSGETVVMKRFDGSMWRQCRTFIRISASGIGAGIKPGDTLECTGLESVLGSHIKVVACEAGEIYCDGCVTKPLTATNVTFKRVIPSFDYVCVSLGRLWGVRRGSDLNGNYVSAVYASAPESPMNFSVYGGGLYRELNVSGSFTGISDYMDTAVAFSESELIELIVKNGEISPVTIKTYGLLDGCADSVVCDSGALYFMSKVGICRYDGSYPECISFPVGSDISKTDSGCPAVCAGGVYYIKVAEKCGKTFIYSYNTLKNRWQRQNDPGVICFAKRKENVYALVSEPEKNTIVLMDYDGADENEKTYCASEGYPLAESGIEWMIESGEMGADEFFSKIPQRAIIRADFSETENLSVSIRTDGVVRSEAVMLPKPAGNVITLPLNCGKCDTFSLIISGVGYIRIDGFSVLYRNGGENSRWN